MQKDKNTDIECLRCIAVLFTMLQHLPMIFPWEIPQWQTLGKHVGFWSGVDLFFVISGFVITRSLLSIYDNNKSNRQVLRKFWIKRVFRLLPSAWLWILIPVAVTWLLPGSTVLPPLHTIINDAIAAGLNLTDLFLPYCISEGRFGELCSNPFIIGHYWSLSLEEQFYVVLPLVLIIIPRKALVPLLVLAIALQFNWGRQLYTYGWFCRTDALMWGVLIGLTHNHPWSITLAEKLGQMKVLTTCLIALLIFLLAYIPAALGGFGLTLFKAPSSVTVGAIALVAAILVWITSYDKNYFSVFFKLRPLLVALGARSYSLYLIHVPTFLLVQHFATGRINNETLLLNYLILGSISIGIILTLTEINYRFLEIPLRDKGKNIANRPNKNNHITQKDSFSGEVKSV